MDGVESSPGKETEGKAQKGEVGSVGPDWSLSSCSFALTWRKEVYMVSMKEV